MLSLDVRNVNEALPLGLMHLRHRGERVVSRGMETMEYPYPVTTMYRNPDECVLFDPDRDANPFFHFMEALWILAGANDVKPMAMMLPRLAEYSDNGIVFHGAYGFRLRWSFGFDQIEAVIQMLRAKPDTRRAVIAIYNPMHDLGADSKDIPCNDLVMFSIRKGLLNMTVCNRSNDVIWGAYGANAVQFAFLQMYVAAKVGVGLGTYHQVSNSYHAYTDNPYWLATKDTRGIGIGNDDPYDSPALQSYDCFTSSVWGLWEHPDALAEEIVTMVNALRANVVPTVTFKNSLIKHVAVPMWCAFKEHKAGHPVSALEWADEIRALDWRKACRDWLIRRYGKPVTI